MTNQEDGTFLVNGTATAITEFILPLTIQNITTTYIYDIFIALLYNNNYNNGITNVRMYLAYNNGQNITNITVYLGIITLIYFLLGYLTYAPILFISAKTGQRVDKLFELINKVAKNNSLRISTSTLNQVINEAIAVVQPPTDKGRRLRICPVL